MSEPRHTSLPWSVGRLESYNAMTGEPIRYVYRGVEETPESRIRVGSGGVFDCDADAEFIVRACNSHYDLLKAAKLGLSILDRVGPETYAREVREAIKKAEGES